ncbi:MAG: hypothetical protein KF819_09565 [Labilithrix sp.]|nr:hypothetical protein [Labilithrix sp.]
MDSLRSRLSLVGLLVLTVASGCAAPLEDETEAADQGVTASRDEGRLLDIPFYFSVPKSVVKTEIDRRAYSYPTVWNTSMEVKDAGLRMIAIRQAGTSPSAKRAARQDMSRQLSRAGVLKDGDVVLSFRPELAGTMAYPHIQMGSTHASLTYTKNGQAYNVDSPLDGEYVGQFDTLHFSGGTNASGGTDLGTDALHILRPAGWDDARRAQLGKWASAVAQNRAYGKVRFQKDYLAPIFATRRMTTKQTVTQLGKIILNQGTMDLPMYCSEFAWHMLALSSCTEAEIRAAGPDGAACVKPVFDPMQLAATDASSVGLTEGPLTTILSAPAADRAGLVRSVFEGGNPGRLSSGHRAVAEQVAPLMAGLSQYYGARAQGATVQMTSEAASQLNAGVQNVPNYSPTAFLVSSMQESGLRKIDYVATVVFVDSDADMQKAKRLAMPQGSSLPQ